MKPRFVIAMLLVLALAVPVSMLAQQSKAEKEVLAVVEEIRQSVIKGGPDFVATLEKYYPDDMVRIPGFGRLLTGADNVAAAKKGETMVESLEYSDLKVRVYGNWAIVTGIETGKGVQVGGVPWTGTFRFSRVFVKRNGIWKNVLYQDTPIAGAAKQ
jgi:ketosteroid isomerase-like protein